MTKAARQNLIGPVVAVIMCLMTVGGGVWKAGADTQKLRDGLDGLDKHVKTELKREDAKIEETKDDVQVVKQEVQQVKETCNDIKREQAVQALEQKYIKEILQRIEKKLDDKE